MILFLFFSPKSFLLKEMEWVSWQVLWIFALKSMTTFISLEVVCTEKLKIPAVWQNISSFSSPPPLAIAHLDLKMTAILLLYFSQSVTSAWFRGLWPYVSNDSQTCSLISIMGRAQVLLSRQGLRMYAFMLILLQREAEDLTCSRHGRREGWGKDLVMLFLVEGRPTYPVAHLLAD